MVGNQGRTVRTTSGEINKKLRYLHFLISMTVVMLFLLIVADNYIDISGEIGEENPVFIVFMCVVVGAGLSCVILSFRLSRQLMRIIEDHRSRLDRILKITKDLREEVHSDILLQKIMDYALSITDAEAGSLLLKEDGRLVFKITRGEKSDALLGRSIEEGKGIIAWVARHGEIVRIEDVGKDPRFNPDFDAMTGFTTRSMLCVPLRTKDGIVGVIAVLNKGGGHTFRTRDEEIITYLADQAAISIIKTKFIEDQKNYEIHLTEMLLEAIDFQIPEKKGHSHRVARYSNLIAKAMSLPEETRRRLYFASLLHDVGFLKITQSETFSKEDFMRHPVKGYEMISPINFYADLAPFILHHHERFDGHGSPSGLKGDEIPLEARIIAVAEAFDVMVSDISYKVPVGFEEAVAELKRTAGAQFDPEIVKAFTENIAPEHTRDTPERGASEES